MADATDLDTLILAYAHSAWGTPLPAFVTEINGPARTPKGKMQEIHLVLVDNNRGDVLAQGFGEALRCIQCGACSRVNVDARCACKSGAATARMPLSPNLTAGRLGPC